MDLEERTEIQELIKESRSPADVGPFYHHSFWEAYKGSLRGKIGGAIIGATVGALIGLSGGGIAMLLGFGGAFGAIVTGITAAGMFYGAKEFGESGRVSGAVAAAHKDGERRMQAFEKAKFAELKQEIKEIKSMLGKPEATTTDTPAPTIDASKVEDELDKYRKTHFSENFPHMKQVVEWKVLLAGLLAGAALGLCFSYFGGTTMILNMLHITGVSAAAATSVATVGLGAVGASFGLNRDLFRQVFDRTDNWFKSVYNYGKKMGSESAPPAHAIDIAPDASEKPVAVSTIIYPETAPDAPTSDTHYRDRVLANAKQALLNLDHTNVRAH